MRIELLKRRQVIAILTALLENLEEFADGSIPWNEVGLQKQDFVDRLKVDTKGVNAAIDALLADHYILHFSRPPKVLWALAEQGTYLAFLLQECIAETGMCKLIATLLFQKHTYHSYPPPPPVFSTYSLRFSFTSTIRFVDLNF